jgi:HD-GYP domain-containing protein (c-di-GMP phosphodiesterase class II)
MTTTRSYREAISHEHALAERRRCAGHQFDPAVVAAFERVMARGRLRSPARIAA